MSTWQGSNGRYSENFERRGGRPQAVQNILKSLFRNRGLDKQISRYQFVMHWKDIVGEQIAKVSRPDFIQDGVLTVRVANSAWAQELSFQKRVILSRLKPHLTADTKIRDIYFRVC